MRKLSYSMGVSLDGFIADRDGAFDWAVPDEELHRFHNDEARGLELHLLGRRLYELMVYWETAPDEPPAHPVEVDFARVWRALPKVVFSSTLESVVGDARIVRGDVVEEVTRLKAESGGTIGIGGAALAGACMEAGLVDEVNLFINPVVVGGGTPFFPALTSKLPLELLETRTFASKAVLLRYRTQGT